VRDHEAIAVGYRPDLFDPPDAPAVKIAHYRAEQHLDPDLARRHQAPGIRPTT
jgi:hypothetical protein